MTEKIIEAIETIRPALQSHGGDVEFVGYKEGIVQVRLQGACGGCPSAQMTLRTVVEDAIRQKVPDIKGVESV
jgi:Fe-S cluster biogenesis protein NfuA